MRQESSSCHVLLANAVRIHGGGERFLVDAGEGLRDRGWRVTVQAQPGSPLAELARTRQLDVHEVRTRANGAPWTVLPLLVWMFRERVDLVLTNFDKDLRTTALAARLTPRRIRVVHSFECDEPMKPRWYLPPLYRSLADLLLFNSACTRQTVLDSAPGLEGMPRAILHKGIAVGEPEDLREPGREFVLGFAGQLVQRKSLPLLLSALGELGSKCRWRLVVAGHGPELDTWRSLADQLGLAARVEFRGFVDDMDALYREFDLLVHPALREGFGYVPLEALARGCPVLARRGGSVEEILHGAPAVRWFDDAEDLPRALTTVLDGSLPFEVEERRAAQDFVRSNYGLDRMLDALETRLRRLIERPGRA